MTCLFHTTRLYLPVVVLLITAAAVHLAGGVRGGGVVALVALLVYLAAQAIACRERIHRHRRGHGHYAA